jgi:hypothetical protein
VNGVVNVVDAVSVPEAARELARDPSEMYRLIFGSVITSVPSRTGRRLVPRDELERTKERGWLNLSFVTGPL